MYKSSLIQLSLIVLGLISATTGVEVLFWHFATIVVRGVGYGFDSITQTAVLGLCSAGAYFLIAWFLISRSREWSASIARLTRVTSNFSIVANPSQVIFFLFISIAIYSLIKVIPEFLQKLYVEFVTRATRYVSEESFYQSRLADWPALVLQMLIPVLLIIFARQLSNFFAAKMVEESNIEIREKPSDEILNN